MSNLIIFSCANFIYKVVDVFLNAVLKEGYIKTLLIFLKIIYNIYKNYGMPNDMLIKLNIAKCTIKEIAIKPVYNVGEQSKMNIIKVIPKISLLLYLGFWKRIIKKYCFKDFHPIFFFYLMGTGAFGGSLYFFFYIVTRFFRSTKVTDGTYQGFVVMFIASLFCTGLAMWFDMYDNDRLQK